MRKATTKLQGLDERALQGGIEWIVARQLAPIEDELQRLRANVETLKAAKQPW